MFEPLRYLDRRVILSGVLAIGILLVLSGLVLFGPDEARLGAAVGLIGLLVALQVAILFFRPADRSPFGQARAAFAANDFAGAAAQLETIIAAKPTTRALTLLGNTYRQLGRLDDSQKLLEQALERAPKNAFALYGMGRTQLTRGNFDTAADWFDKALAAGAPSPVACDLGIAEYFAGNEDAAISTLTKATRILQIEPYRALIANAILWHILTLRQNMAAAKAAENMRRDADGLAYWQAELERHRATPYGEALAVLVNEIEAYFSPSPPGEGLG